MFDMSGREHLADNEEGKFLNSHRRQPLNNSKALNPATIREA
jgi:hypothetical protein